MEKVNVMISCSKKGVVYMGPQLRSIQDSLANYVVDLYFFHSEISCGDMEFVNSFIINHCPNINLIEIRVEDASEYKAIARSCNKYKEPYENYFRLSAYEYMPRTVERLLYLEAIHVRMQGSVSHYYFDDFEGKSLLVTKELFENDNDEETFETSICVMNIKKMRKERTKMNEYISIAHAINYRRGIIGQPCVDSRVFVSTVFSADIKYFKSPRAERVTAH